MKIGLLSDTHGYLDPKIFTHFEAVDEIWHAGDIGDNTVVTALEKFKPFKAVFGNIDELDLRTRFPEDLWWECEGFTLWMTHIGGAPPNYNPRIKNVLQSKVPTIFICGHSHILRVKKDPHYNNMLYLNPGAAGNQGFHHIKTLIRFELLSGEIKNMEVIELGTRGAI